MKPAPFEYVRPQTVEDVLEALASHPGATLLAGGQSLLPLLHVRELSPSMVIDIGGLTELDYIEAHDDHLAVGAATRMRKAELSPEVAAWAPLVVTALRNVASVPVRNRGTVGGSLAFARPSAELPSVAVALDAELCIAQQGEVRTVRARDFFLGPHQTVLSSRDLLTEIRIPQLPTSARWAMNAYSRRRNDLALAAAYVGVGVDADGRCDFARVVLGGVGATPLRMEEAERILVGAEPTPELIDVAAAAAVTVVDPPTDWMGSGDFRRHLVGVVTRRALRAALPTQTKADQ